MRYLPLLYKIFIFCISSLYSLVFYIAPYSFYVMYSIAYTITCIIANVHTTVISTKYFLLQNVITSFLSSEENGSFSFKIIRFLVTFRYSSVTRVLFSTGTDAPMDRPPIYYINFTTETFPFLARSFKH